MNVEMFLKRIYDSIKVGDMIQKPTRKSEILDIRTNGSIFYRIGETNKKDVTKKELVEVFNILQNRDLLNDDISRIIPNSKRCNATSIKWLLTHSGVAVEVTKGCFAKNW